MGTFNDLLKTKPNFGDLAEKRKKLINKIQEETGRKLLIYASDTDFKGDPRNVMISAEDRTAFIELVESIDAETDVDLLIESPGGYIEAVEDFVHILRNRFPSIRFVIPNVAKSAATIMAMSGNNILMDYRSTLGPIDAQINFRGRSFAAQAFLEGLQKILREAEETKSLQRGYIPILQNISPAEIQACEDADKLSRKLVSKWLKEYMFADLPAKESDKKGEIIASKLCDRTEWLSHGRSIRITDLNEWGLKIIDYSKYKKLSRYLWELWVHIFWTFKSNVIKLFESEKINIYRHFNVRPQAMQPLSPGKAVKAAKSVVFENKCPSCGNVEKFHLKFEEIEPPEPGIKDYPKNDRYTCERCGANIDLSSMRLDMEKLKGKKAILK